MNPRLLLGIAMLLFCACKKTKDILLNEPNNCELPSLVSFSNHILPILNTHCGTNDCHQGNSPMGGYRINDFDDVKNLVKNNLLLPPIEHQVGYSPMPKGMNKLDECQINLIKAWINDGAYNN